MSKLKNFIRNNLLGAIIGGLVFGASGVIADTIVKSNDVSYKETDVKAAVDDLYRVAGIHVEDIESELMLKIYPVGSIYTSISSTSPAELFGGTWERFGKGKTLVSVDEDNTNFQTVEKTGGSETKTISVENLPSHEHTYKPSGTLGNTGGGGTHNHSVSNTSSTRTSNANNRGHTHKESHQQAFNAAWGAGVTAPTFVNGNAQSASTGGESQNHTHTYTDYYANTTTGNHTLTIAQMPSHNHTFTGTASSTTACTNCNGTALNTQDPYITVYMWKRTA